MKRLMLAAPALALFAGAALAQADTTSGGAFGTNWPLSVGTTFFADAEGSTLRSTEEISTGWKSLSQEDRDMIKADCTSFMAAHGDAAATDATTATGTADTGAAISGATSTGTDAATTAPAGYDLAEMKAICEAVGTL